MHIEPHDKQTWLFSHTSLRKKAKITCYALAQCSLIPDDEKVLY